jgi:hypothetical protein
MPHDCPSGHLSSGYEARLRVDPSPFEGMRTKRLWRCVLWDISFGAQEQFTRELGPLLSTPERGFNVAVAVDADNPPASAGKCSPRGGEGQGRGLTPVRLGVEELDLSSLERWRADVVDRMNIPLWRGPVWVGVDGDWPC